LPADETSPAAAELSIMDLKCIVDSPQLPEISYDDYDADDECNHSLYFGGAVGKHPLSLK
jgi:hypothetical protein